jgi:hypothetical protein
MDRLFGEDWSKPAGAVKFFPMLQLIIFLFTFSLALVSDCFVFSNCIPSMLRLPASSPFLFKVRPT